MDDVEVRPHAAVTKTHSKFISEAFNFLNDAGYIEDEVDGVPRISTSLSDSRLSILRQRESKFNGLKSDFNQSLPETVAENKAAEDYRVGTSMKQTEKEVEPIVNDNSTKDGETGAYTGGCESDKNDFTIVTYVEGENKNDFSKDHTKTIPGNMNEEPHITTMKDDDVVLRRKSGDSSTSLSRVQTWRQNQQVVSEAFDFLKDIEGVTDTVSMLSMQFTDNADQNLSDNISASDSTVADRIVSSSRLLTRENAVDEPLVTNSFNVETSEASEISRNGDFHKSGSCPLPSSLENVLLNASASKSRSEQSSEVSFSGSSENDELGELGGAKLRNRRRHKQDSNDDDGGSSDEDTGVYRESFRKSTWVYVGDDGGVSLPSVDSSGTKESGYVSLADIDTTDPDSVFDVPANSLLQVPRKSHKRNESTATTASEQEFRNAYNSVRNRLVSRKDSQQEYKRMTEKFYDQQTECVLTKTPESGYGIHLLHSRPAIISGVDKGSPAELAGVKEGQIVISINSVNVLDADHDEIIRLVQETSNSMQLEVGYSDVQYIRDLQQPVMTGFLLKQTSTTIFKTWKRRFFILRHDNCLYYYKNEQESDPLGAIQLSGYVFSRHGDHNKCGFKAEKYGNRTYYFQAENRDDMTRWVGALNESSERGKDKKDAWMDVTSQNVGLPALEIRKPDCSGYLFKMARATKRWRKRYCVVKDACIYYYKNANSKEAEGVAHLHGYSVDETGLPGKQFSFCLQPPEPQMRVFSFYTDNDTDKNRWIVALSKSIQKWVRVD